jgi:putative glutamine amidotransferase
MSIVIGITPAVSDVGDSSLISTYSYAIEHSGATPIVLPYVTSKESIMHFADMCDGFFFTGGMDIEPAVYGQEKKETCDQTQPKRDELELALFEAAFATGKPILGICRGMQLINAILGGTLYQDIPTETNATISHRQTEARFEFSHDIRVIKDSPLYSLLGKERIRGNSFHHQALDRLGDELKVLAESDDGIIEGFYHAVHPYLRAYQWHPERLFDKDCDARLIFSDFISACKELR